MTDVPTAQCESCGDRYPENDLNYKSVPGALLAFCDDCVEPPRAKQYGVVTPP